METIIALLIFWPLVLLILTSSGPSFARNSWWKWKGVNATIGLDVAKCLGFRLMYRIQEFITSWKNKESCKFVILWLKRDRRDSSLPLHTIQDSDGQVFYKHKHVITLRFLIFEGTSVTPWEVVDLFQHPLFWCAYRQMGFYFLTRWDNFCCPLKTLSILDKVV